MKTAKHLWFLGIEGKKYWRNERIYEEERSRNVKEIYYQKVECKRGKIDVLKMWIVKLYSKERRMGESI